MGASDPLNKAKTAEEARRLAADALIQLKHQPGWGILLGFLEIEAQEALEKLVKADPTNPPEVMKLQNTVERYRWYKDSIDELIVQGLQPEVLAEAETGDAEVEDDGT